jgi:opacity protein-like surface antigen
LLFKYEYALTSLIGVGAVVGFGDTKLTETFNYQEYNYDPNTGNYFLGSYSDITKSRFSSFSIGARLNFHFGTMENLDPYAGIASGYSKMFYSYSYTSNNPSKQVVSSSYDGIPVYFAMTAGIRYYFTKNIGAYVELGFDKWSIIQGGLAIKF